MENSLDACESIGELGEELTLHEFKNRIWDIRCHQGHGIVPRQGNSKVVIPPVGGDDSKKKNGNGRTPTKHARASGEGGCCWLLQLPERRASQEGYFCIQVKDNGCGMQHEKVPDLLGRGVLSGSKYGVRQTWWKFELGAKMALIWSKKSTG
jgi:DNA topoisomerase-6 subunit B